MDAVNEDNEMYAEGFSDEPVADFNEPEAMPLPMDADLHRSGSALYLLLCSSHSLRTIFHSSLGFLDIATSDMLPGLDTRHQSYLKESELNLRAISALLEEMIEMARVETGIEITQTATTRAETLFGMAAQRLIRRGITVECDIPGDVMVAADMPKFIRAFYNLLISLSADKGGTYFVGLEGQGKDGMLSMKLRGTMNVCAPHTLLSTAGMAALGPKINLECFRGWISLMGGSVSKATLNHDGMEMLFLLRQAA